VALGEKPGSLFVLGHASSHHSEPDTVIVLGNILIILLKKYSGRRKFMPLSPKTTQIQIILSRVKEVLEKRGFRHLK
jgi:hypothetical protein